MSVDAGTLTAVTGDVFAGLFGEDDGRPYPDEHAAPLPVTAWVQVSGAFDCEVSVACGRDLVVDAAARLFAIAPDDVTDADLHDVAGELANVVGGNVKSMLPGPSVLSLPVTDLDSPTSRPADRPADLAVDLTWRRLPLRVAVRITDPTEGNPS